MYGHFLIKGIDERVHHSDLSGVIEPEPLREECGRHDMILVTQDSE